MNLTEFTGLDADPRSFQPSDLLPIDTMVGVEIELEGMRYIAALPFRSKYWNIKEDGSLRNYGAEFVFKTPLSGVDIENALGDFDNYIKSYSKRYNPPEISERCSLHTHIDMRGEEMDVVRKYILFFATFEKMLFNIFGKGRESNHFCIPINRSTAKSYLHSLFSKKGDIYRALKLSKYLSLNTLPAFNLGSFEIRLHRGTYSVDEIFLWIAVLLSIKNAATSIDLEIDDYPAFVSDIGITKFLKLVFDDYLDDKLYDNYEDDVLMGIRDAQDILYLSNLKLVDNHLKRRKSSSNRMRLFLENNKMNVIKNQ